MERKDIEKAAKKQLKGIVPCEWNQEPFIDIFVIAAQWRIQSAWHNPSEMLPGYDESVLVEYELYGEKNYCFSHRSNNPIVETTEYEFCFYHNGKIIRWAYIKDLIPDKEK